MSGSIFEFICTLNNEVKATKTANFFVQCIANLWFTLHHYIHSLNKVIIAIEENINGVLLLPAFVLRAVKPDHVEGGLEYPAESISVQWEQGRV